MSEHYYNYEVCVDPTTNESYVRIEVQDGEWVETKVWDRSVPGDEFVVTYPYSDTTDGVIAADTLTRHDALDSSYGFAENYLWEETISALEYLINKYEL